jgi:hypothetical protein
MDTNRAQPTPDPKHRREPIHPDDVEAGVGQARDSDNPLADTKPGSVTNERRDDAQPRSSTKPMAEKKPGSGA